MNDAPFAELHCCNRSREVFGDRGAVRTLCTDRRIDLCLRPPDRGRRPGPTDHGCCKNDPANPIRCSVFHGRVSSLSSAWTEFCRGGVQCPQHDILFEKLTPAQHLKLFAGIKGAILSKEELDRLLSVVDLLDKRDSKAADLSGGQKRKLSVAIALMGDPKLLILDEVNTHNRHVSRRFLACFSIFS